MSKDQLQPQTSNLIMKKITKVVTSAFETFRTEKSRLAYFAETGTYKLPESIVIGQGFDTKKLGGVSRMESFNCVEQFIPLRHVLRSFLSLDNVMFDILEYIESLVNHPNVIQNFIQGSFWQSKKSTHGGRLAFPLFVFFDDYETGHVLESHSGQHKLGAVYTSTIPCLPPHMQSALSNIFLTLLFHSSDRIKFGNNVIFKPLIDELNYLREVGIEIDLPAYKGTVYFEIGLIRGDNLGIHSITGFVESFSSNFSCRVCKVEKSVHHKQIYEDKSLLRNSMNYANDVALGNPSLTGVLKKSVYLMKESLIYLSR
jgi:hypothetical protein